MICSKCSGPMTWDDADKAMACMTCGNRVYSEVAKAKEPTTASKQPKAPASSNHQDAQKAIESLLAQAHSNWQRLYEANVATQAEGDQRFDAYIEMVCEEASPDSLAKLFTMWSQVLYQMPPSEYATGAFCAIAAVKAYLDEVVRLQPKC